MSSSRSNLERRYSYKEAFLASLSHSVATPTADWPTVRCWTKTSLDRMFKTVKGTLGKSTPRQSNLKLLNWMQKLGLAWAIEADGATFYLLEMGASPKSQIDPLELMMASQPFGVVCYFSALAFHSLTSQMPSHHHVAMLTEPSRIENVEEARKQDAQEGLCPQPIAEPVSNHKTTTKKASPFGKLIFSYRNLNYYLTRRTKRLVPGVQKMSNGPRGQFRITTYEQTLLDALYKPQNCGGPAVVLEAWQEASRSGRLEEDRLVGYLTQIDHPFTTRRSGSMLKLMGYTPGDELASYLDRAKQQIDREAPYSQISLLPGFDYSNLDDEWLVKSP
jgi:hypothetical protein